MIDVIGKVWCPGCLGLLTCMTKVNLRTLIVYVV